MNRTLLEADRADMEERVMRAVAQDMERIVGRALAEMLADLERFRAGQHGRREVLERVDGFQRSTSEVLANLQDMFNGLGPAGEGADLIAELREVLAGCGLEVSIEASQSWPRPMKAAAAAEITRIVQEAALNARRHGGARRIRIALRAWSGGWAVLNIMDDGIGLKDAGLRPGLGTRGMSERAAGLGGRLQVRRAPNGHGVSVRACFPLETLR